MNNDQDRRIAVLRSTLAELERSAPMPDDLIDRLVDRAYARGNAPAAPRRARRWVAPLAAAAVVAALAGLIAVINSGRSGPVPAVRNSATPVPVAQWPSYTAPGFRVRYPPTWRPYKTNFANTFTTGIISFSTQPVPSPCRTLRVAGGIACGIPVVPLRDGGVLVFWDATSGFVQGTAPIKSQPGRPSTINGHRAKIAITAPKPQTSCARSGGTREVTISIAAARYTIIAMTACLSGEGQQVDALTHTVITSARTLRLHH